MEANNKLTEIKAERQEIINGMSETATEYANVQTARQLDLIDEQIDKLRKEDN